MNHQEHCPVCGTRFRMYKNCEVGEWLECSGCHSDLEVIWSDPVTLLQSPREIESWEE